MTSMRQGFLRLCGLIVVCSRAAALAQHDLRDEFVVERWGVIGMTQSSSAAEPGSLNPLFEGAQVWCEVAVREWKPRRILELTPRLVIRELRDEHGNDLSPVDIKHSPDPLPAGAVRFPFPDPDGSHGYRHRRGLIEGIGGAARVRALPSGLSLIAGEVQIRAVETDASRDLPIGKDECTAELAPGVRVWVSADAQNREFRCEIDRAVAGRQAVFNFAEFLRDGSPELVVVSEKRRGSVIVGRGKIRSGVQGTLNVHVVLTTRTLTIPFRFEGLSLPIKPAAAQVDTPPAQTTSGDPDIAVNLLAVESAAGESPLREPRLNTQPRAGLRIGVMPIPGPIRIAPDPRVQFLEVREQTGGALDAERCQWDYCPGCERWFHASHPGQVERGAIVAACLGFDKLPRGLELVRGTVTVREIVHDHVVFIDNFRPGDVKQVDTGVRVLCKSLGAEEPKCQVLVEFGASTETVRFVSISELGEGGERQLAIFNPDTNEGFRPRPVCLAGASLRVQVVDQVRERVIPFEFANISLCGESADEVRH